MVVVVTMIVPMHVRSDWDDAMLRARERAGTITLPRFRRRFLVVVVVVAATGHGETPFFFVCLALNTLKSLQGQAEKDKMKIGELAKQAGCPVETVRYYEREGLLHAAVRNEVNNYRQYDHSHLDRLTFIRHCRALDMTHGEIRALLEARQQPDASCESINELIDTHLRHVQARMAELKALETQLIDLRGQCQAARAMRDCGILRELDQPGEAAWRGPSAPPSHVSGSHCATEMQAHVRKNG